MSPAVAVRDAFRIFGEGPRASVGLQGLTLEVDEGEIVVVLGPSGSGKTTLLRTVAGLDRLSAGTATVLGADVGLLSGRRLASFRAERLGFLDQHYTRALAPELSIRRTIALPLLLRGETPAEAERVADALLERVGLRDRGADRPKTLSGGEQQRVAVCASVAHGPRLMLVDEPAGELDAESAARVYQLLGDVVRRAGASAIVVSHDAAAADIADRIVHVRDGRVVEEARPGEEAGLVVARGGWIRLPLRDPDGGRVAAEGGGETVVRRLRGSGVGGAVRPLPAPATERGEVVGELRAADKAYGDRRVLRGVDLAAERGRMVAVVGRSGSGKTTLLHLLAGLEAPTSGQVVVAGRDLGGLSRAGRARLRREAVAIVTQEPGLVPHLSARENVALGIGLRGGEAMAGRAEGALAAVGLRDLAHRRAATLSAGERQRVAVARAIASGAALLLADEPTARLDEENALAVGGLLARAAREHGLAVLCATHDPLLIELADSVVRLDVPAA